MNENGWDTWRKYVLKNLEENKEEHKSISDTLQSIDHKLTVLQTEHRLGKYFGTTLVAGIVSIIVSFIIHMAGNN
jgi:hypothetical protein